MRANAVLLTAITDLFSKEPTEHIAMTGLVAAAVAEKNLAREAAQSGSEVGLSSEPLFVFPYHSKPRLVPSSGEGVPPACRSQTEARAASPPNVQMLGEGNPHAVDAPAGRGDKIAHARRALPRPLLGDLPLNTLA